MSLDFLQYRLKYVAAKTRAQHRFSTRCAAMLQNKLQVFVARFTFPLALHVF